MNRTGFPNWLVFVLFAFFAMSFGGSWVIPAIVIYMVARYGFMQPRGRDGSEEEQRRRSNRRDERYGRRQRPQERSRESDSRRDWEYRRQQERQKSRQMKKPKNNPFKLSGIEKYKDYDFNGAIADFKKALAIDASDVAVHFNMACAYSINEEPDNSFFHLSKAVEYGFSDFEKIKSHDALAYLRIQPEFEDFVKRGYKLGGSAGDSAPKNTTENNNLLEQLNKLAELREKGLLTEEEFAQQKKKLLG